MLIVKNEVVARYSDMDASIFKNTQSVVLIKH